jgi:hypothetical protein
MRADDPNELVFQFLALSVSAKGIAALMVGVAVALLIGAIAWRILGSSP